MEKLLRGIDQPIDHVSTNLDDFFLEMGIDSLLESPTEEKKPCNPVKLSKCGHFNAKSRKLVILALRLFHIVQVLNKVKIKLKRLNSADVNGIMKFIDGNTYSNIQWSRFTEHFEKVHPDFFVRLGEHCKDLTEHEMRICAYIRMRMDNKSITSMLCISPRGFDTARYRLKKKLGLPSTMNLSEFIMEV